MGCSSVVNMKVGCVFNSPTVIVLCNQEPIYDKLSPDRWDVHEINIVVENLMLLMKNLYF